MMLSGLDAVDGAEALDEAETVTASRRRVWEAEDEEVVEYVAVMVCMRRYSSELKM